MLKKLLLTIVFFTTSIFANEDNLKEVNTDKFQLLSKSVSNDLYIIKAKGSVLLTTPKYYILADELIYYKESKVAEVFGNVAVIQNGTSQLISEYAYFDFANDIKVINPVLLLEQETNLWINSQSIDTNPEKYSFGMSTISSCDCYDPAWSIRASSANHDNVNKWMHLYNMRLYIGDVPVFYLPYFGYPTDNTRRTGLLAPILGYSKDEGFLYAQPIYFAPADDWDLEFVPQNRVKRGSGVYTTYRFADSPYSTLKFKTGIFKEKVEYADTFNLENDKHYGFNLDYNRSNLFEDKDSNDALSIWLDWMNDIDYRNLDSDSISATGDDTSYGTSRESYINYYYDMAKWYNGIYFKYYLDTEVDNNDATLQQLPQYQSHLYTDSVIFDKLIYSVDFMNTNYDRKEGITANKTDINIPLSYEFSFFDDFLFFKLKEDTTLSTIQYGLEDGQNYKNGNYVRSIHQASLSTDLIKPYTDIAHSINLGIDYSIPKVYTKNGDLYGVTTTNDDLSSFVFTESERSIALSMKNYFYSIESKGLLVSDSLSQSFDYKNEKYVATNLENQLTINYSLGSISNRMIFNQEDDEYILSSSSFSLAKNSNSLKITHYKTKESENTSYDNDESMTLAASMRFAKRYTLGYSNSYDILNKETSKEVYSIKYDEKCWDITFQLQDSLVTSSSTTSSAVRQDSLYVTFNLKPLGGYVYKYKMDEREE